MNALADSPAAVPLTLARPSQNSYALGLLAALAVHAAIIFGWPKPQLVIEQVEFGVEAADSSVEVALVAALPAEEPKETVEPPPVEPPIVEPPPPPPEVMPEPPPIPVKPLEMTIPEPAPAPQPPKPKLQKPAPPKPPRIARASGDGSSTIPGNDATTAKVSAGALSAKPGYLRNPHPAYPEEARAAGQQGLVTLSVQVDALGRVAAVRLVRSSGFPVLDERARSTVASRWAFKPAKSGGVPIASDVIIPIRFTLNR